MHPFDSRRRRGGIRLLALAAALALPVGGVAHAQNAAPTDPGVRVNAGADPAGADGSFTPSQRAAIVAIVRHALATDPSILADAITALRSADAQRAASNAAGAIAANRQALDDPAGNALAGNPAGRVTVVEFYDPRCPYCRRMVPTIDDAIAADRGLRVVFKVIPILGPPSVVASEAIVAAGLQGGYVAMEKALMNSDVPADDASIAADARRIGLDPARLARDMVGPTVAARLRANLTLAHALGVDGTPAFVIGDRLVPGAMTADELRGAIQAARG